MSIFKKVSCDAVNCEIGYISVTVKVKVSLGLLATAEI
jgi:hypothetical protein